MIVPLKAFIIIYPQSPYPNKADIYIGGVASSAAHEQAGEEGGIVVPLTGSYDTEDLKKEVVTRIEDYTAYVQQYEDKGVLTKFEQSTLDDYRYSKSHYETMLKNLEELEKNPSNFTNFIHFNDNELFFLKAKRP